MKIDGRGWVLWQKASNLMNRHRNSPRRQRYFRTCRLYLLYKNRSLVRVIDAEACASCADAEILQSLSELFHSNKTSPSCAP